MSLNCIIGDITFDKGKYIYNKIAENEKNGKNNLVFVPSQARMSAEEEYMLKTGKNGMINTNITTMSRYILNTIDESSLKSKKYITDDEKRMYVKSVISNLKDKLEIFNKVVDKPTFVDIVLSYMDSIKRDDINIEKIDKIENIDALTKMKLKEIAYMCEILEKKLSEKYVDSFDMLDLFSQYILENKKKYEETEIYFYGYNNFSKKELSVIKSFLELGKNVNVSLTIPTKLLQTEVKENIFEIPYKTYSDLVTLGKECGVVLELITDIPKLNLKEDVEFLIKNIFNMGYDVYTKESKNIELKLEKNLSYEIESIAKDIVEKIRKDDTLRYKDFAIYTNNFEEYEFCIKRLFEEYDIEYHFDDTSEVEFSNLTIYLIYLLKLINNGLDVNTLFVFLKTGLFNISKEDLNYFENYIIEFGIKGYMLNKEFKKNNKESMQGCLIYDLSKLNNTRAKIVKYINEISINISERLTAKDKVLVIYEHLVNNGILKRYIDDVNVINEESVKAGSLRKQVVDVIYEVFDNISEINDTNNISNSEFLELFEFGIKDRKIKTIPMTIDQVEICDINKTRILPKRYVYMIGAYENGLPSISSEDSIFSDKELEKMQENSIDIKQNSLVRTNMALFNVYMALANVKEHLTITMPVSKITGEPLRAGVIVNEIKRILNIKAEGNISEDDMNMFDEEKMTTQVIFRNLLNKIVNLEDIDNNELSYLYNLYLYYIEKDDKYKKILEYSRKDENLSNEVLEKLYSDKLNSSVSKLEMFKKCPFSYYTNYILNIKPRKKYSLSVMDMGTLMHDCLEKFSKWIVERSLMWQEVVTDENVAIKAKGKIEEIIDKIFEEKYFKYKENNRYIVLKANLKRKMFKIIKIIATSFNQSEFKPLGYEVEFKNGALYSPIEVNLENGKTMYLVGKIDRIDSAVVNDKVYLRIVDYKSSNKSININDIKEGISLQLMTYMSALINNKQNIDIKREVLPAAINYFTLRADIKRLDEFTDDEAKINKELIKAMKLKGIYLSDVKILESIDRKYKDTNNSFIDINSRNINDKNKVVNEEEFKNICDEIKQILKDIGKEISNGVVKINPKKCNGKLPCEYCEYTNICRKNIRA